MSWKIKKFKKLTGKIRVKTGLHIGGGQDVMEIGGNDNPIIRNPADNEPYIPGSSLKGKMRSLMEWHLGLLHPEGKVHACENKKQALQCPICRTFGISAAEGLEIGITRLIVRDCLLSDKSREDFMAGRGPLTEDKTENSINRITAVANPRSMERVVPGTIFDMELVFRVLDADDDGTKDEELFNDVVLKGLALLEQDFLGGGGSRGNGRVEFIDLVDENGTPVTLPAVEERTA